MALAISMILNLFTFVSARTIIEPNVNVAINKTVELYYKNGSSLVKYDGYTGYEGGNMLDGNADTFCYNKAFTANKSGYSAGHLAIIDLGDYYDITKIVVNPETTKNAANELGFTTENGYTNISTPNGAGRVVVSQNKPVASQFVDNTFTTSGDTNGVMLANTAQSSNFNATRTFNESDSTKYRYVSVWAGWSNGFAISEIEIYANVEKEVPDELYVSPNGSDDNDGSQSRPFKTIERAKEKVRELKTGMDRDIVVHIAGGRYELSETLDFDEEDSGENGFNIVYEGDPDNMPTISAGKELDLTWTEGDDGIWSAKVNDTSIEYIRNLYVNETPAERASSSKLVYGLENYVASGSSYTSDGFYVNKADIGVFANQEDIQLRWTIGWKSWLFYVNEIVNDPSNSDRVIVKMNNPLWSSESHEDRPSGWPQLPRYDYGFRVENAYELLDEPGEFYFNRSTRTLSYMPREGEDMASATVVAPNLDKIMSVTGNPSATTSNVLEFVKNIKFKNLRFAHSNFSELEESDMIAYQCEILHMTNVPRGIVPGAVEVGFADNINIEDCVFFGMNSAALELTDKVSNSNFQKNVFTDIGFGAFIVGHHYHNTADQNAWSGQWRDNRGVVSFRKGWTTSNQKSKAFSSSINTIVENPESLAVHGIWRSEPDAAAKGITPWVKMDLGKEYNIHSVMLSFADCTRDGVTETISDEEKRNFQILLSNDENFETYSVMTTRQAPIGETLTTSYGTVLEDSIIYENSVQGKFRYVMVKKTVAEKFAMSLMRVYSFDEKAIGVYGVNVNNTFQNNYIARVGVINNASSAVTALDADGLKILHNEFEDIPYSGVSIGYGWDNIRSATAGNNEIKNNKFSDVEKIASDGGAIYTASNQSAYVNGAYDTENKKPLEVSGNYIKNQGNIIAGLYSDSGSACVNYKDNVLQNASLALYASGGSSTEREKGITKQITLENTYADDLEYRNGNTSENTIGTIKRYSAEQMPAEAMEIVLNAGIEESAEYIKSRIPDNESPFIVGPYGYAAYMAAEETPAYAPDKAFFASNVVNTMLEIGNFGNLPWQYDAKYKHQLQYWLDRSVSDDNRTDDVYVSLSRNGFPIEKSHMNEFIELDKTYKAAAASATHLSYDEMLAMCKEKSASLNTNDYSSSSISAFNSAISTAEKADHSTKSAEYAAVLAMESAYETLEKGRVSADLLYAYAEDGDVEIDYVNKTAVITVPANVTASSVRPTFTAMPGASVQGTYTYTDFSNGASVTLKKDSKTTTWTVTVKNKAIAPSGEKTVINHTSNWLSDNVNSAPAQVGDGVRVQPWITPTMYKDAFGNTLNFSVKAEKADNINGINFIFGAKTCDDLEPEGYYKKNTYYMLNLKNQTLTLYKVDSGKSTTVATASNVGFNYGSYNDFVIRDTATGTGDTLTIALNGVTKFNQTVSSSIGTEGYFGVYNKVADVDIKPYGLNLTDVAKGKYAYANWYLGDNHPSNMTDGDSNTRAIVCNHSDLGSAENAMYSYIDLGEAYKLTEIDVDFVNGSDAYSGLSNTYINVYVTNSRPDGNASLEKTKVGYTAGTNAQGTSTYYVGGNTAYRYILFEKKFSSGMSIGEVRAYSQEEASRSYIAGVSKNKAAMGTVGDIASGSAENAVDNNISTAYKSSTTADTSKGERLVIDLGKGYNIEALALALDSNPSAGDINIYATNNIDLSDKVLALTLSDLATTNYTTRIQYKILDSAVRAEEYRYVVIEKTTLGGLGVNEFEVIARLGADETVDTTDNSLSLISRGKTVISLDGLMGLTSSNKTPGEINNGDYAYSGYVSNKSSDTMENDQFIYVDLGAAYEIPYVGVMTNTGYFSMCRNYQIVGSNVEPTADTEAENFTILYDGSTDVLPTTEGSMRYYHTRSEYAGHRFRYIGVRKPYASNSDDTRIVLKELDVYTYTDKENTADLSASVSGNTLTVKANLELDETKSYPVVIGGYTEDKTMTNVIYSKIGLVDGQWMIENTYDISGFSNDAKIIRVHLFESANSIMPLCKRAEVSR